MPRRHVEHGRVVRSVFCQTDADCGPGTRCYVDSPTNTCVTGDGGQQQCSSNACVPQWEAPCSVDTDCGSGFTCSGSGGYTQFVCGTRTGQPVPPYATETPTPCPAPPLPLPLPAGFVPPFSCDAGPGACFSVAWKTCVAEATPPCAVDADCPPTWTCGCKATCPTSGIELPPSSDADAPAPIADTGCTLTCVPPNSDLLPPLGCFSAIGNASSPPASATAPTTGVADGGTPYAHSSAAPADTTGTTAQGGCQVGPGGESPGWFVLAIPVLTWAAGGDGGDGSGCARRSGFT